MAKLDGFTDVCAMTRCSGYVAPVHTNSATSPPEGEEREERDGNKVRDLQTKHYTAHVYAEMDPTLLFHQRKGADIVAISHNYRVRDVNNIGHAVCISYARCELGAISPENLPKLSLPAVAAAAAVEVSSSRTPPLPRPPAPPATPAAAEKKFSAPQLESLIKLVLHIPYSNSIEMHAGKLGFLDTPFMEMGLDSLQIMELQSMLNAKLKLSTFSSTGTGDNSGKNNSNDNNNAGDRRGGFVPLDSTVLFDYPTPRRLLDKIQATYFQDNEMNGGNGNSASSSSSSSSSSDKAKSRADKVSSSARANVDEDEDEGLYAICGMSCRFPGTGNDSPEAFFDLLLKGVDTTGPVPASWKTSTRRAAFLDKKLAETFDPAFFGLSLEEAVNMNPHQRVLLELAHEALVEAQITSETFGKPRQPVPSVGTSSSSSNGNSDWGSTCTADLQKTGVFVGLCNNEWVRSTADRERRNHKAANQSDGVGPYTGISISQASVANSISFLLGFTGPSMVLDTACSSSLVALHTACQSLGTRVYVCMCVCVYVCTHARACIYAYDSCACVCPN